MRTLYYQCGAGISGDMHLGAMVDLGVPEAVLREGLARLPCADEFQMAFTRSQKMGITGVRAQVRDLRAAERGPSSHRHYGDIVALIEAAGFQAGVQRRALAIFEQIAVAEAKIHDIPVHKVHFHEVGAVDAIVDIVGAALALAYLDVQQVCCSLVEVGSGFVDCAHGRLPVPAPATQEILSGVPCTYGGVLGEATTPTGAAILKVAVDCFQPPPAFSPQRVGYGLGTRDFTIPNVLRVVLGEGRRLRRTQDEAASWSDSPEATAGVRGMAEAGQGRAPPMRPSAVEQVVLEEVRDDAAIRSDSPGAAAEAHGMDGGGRGQTPPMRPSAAERAAPEGARGDAAVQPDSLGAAAGERGQAPPMQLSTAERATLEGAHDDAAARPDSPVAPAVVCGDVAVQPDSPGAAAGRRGASGASGGQAPLVRPSATDRAAPERVRIEDGHCKLEANLDDLSPEAYEPLMEHLLALGASDVYLTPIIMKKSRPAVCLSVLCEAHLVDSLADAVFNRSTTIGLRVTSLQKRVLPREIRRMETRHGAVQVKLVTQPDGRRRWKAEHDDVRQVADAQGLDYMQTRTLLDEEIAKLLAAD